MGIGQRLPGILAVFLLATGALAQPPLDMAPSGGGEGAGHQEAGQTAGTQEAPRAEVQAFPDASKVIPRRSQLTEDADQAQARIEDLARTEPFKKELEQARERQETLARRFEQLGAPETWSIERLLDIRGALVERRGALKGLLDEVSAQVAELEDLRKEWQERRDFWSQWAEHLRGPDASVPLEAFGEARQVIEEVLGMIAAAADGLIALQKEVTELQESHLERLSRVEQTLEGLRRETFRKTAPSFANPVFYRQFGGEHREQLGAGLLRLREPSEEFLRSQGWFLVLQLALALGLGLFIRGHRHDPDFSREWQFILRHPWATGLFAAAAGMSFFYTAPPALWRLLMWGVTVLSGSLLMTGMLENRRKTAVVLYLAGLFLLSLTLQTLDLPQPLYRLYLAVVSLASVPVLLRAATLESRSRGGGGSFFILGLRAGSLLMLTVFTAQCAGYTILSSRLFEASLETVFLGLLTAMAILLVRGGVAYLLSRRLLRKSRFVRRAGPELGARLKTLFDTFLVGYALLYLLVIWGAYDSVLQVWSEVLGLGFRWGEVEVTVRMILLAVLVIYLAIIVSWVLRSVLEWEVFPRKGMDRGVRDAVQKLLHYSLIFVGFLLAVSLAGIDLKSFAVVAGAFGIGIGFGLQNIVNNFVSGIILLFERPVKVGDMVVLDGEWGTISKIGLRSTVVETYDQSEIIVPNSELVSQKVVNWTFTDRAARVVLPVGVAYGSDLEKVLRVLQEAGKNHPKVLAEPPVSPIFVGFGNSSLDFELRVWIADINDRLVVRSELGQDVDRRFRQEGIEIPFPQRDLHLRSVAGTVLDRVRPGGPGTADAPPPQGGQGAAGEQDDSGDAS